MSKTPDFVKIIAGFERDSLNSSSIIYWLNGFEKAYKFFSTSENKETCRIVVGTKWDKIFLG